jgi:hypothetical protein
MKQYIVFFISCLATFQCLAYPITPRPLRQLILESQYVISGNVISITELDHEPDSNLPMAVAKIQITQIFKGEILTGSIDVYFENYYGCPQPAHYEPDTSVMAFLDLEDGKFSTHALSYGAKTLSPDELEIYKSRIIEMQDILKITDPLRLYQETVNWLITCAENEATQWEGIFELSPQSDFMSSYSKNGQMDYGQFLSAGQKDRLFRILQKKHAFDYGDFGIVDLVYGGNEKFIDGQLIKSLNNLQGFELIFAGEYMHRLKHLVPKRKFDAFIGKQEALALDFGESNEKKQRKNIVAFLAEINKQPGPNNR